MATELVADLMTASVAHPDAIVDDALCGRLGALLYEADQAQMDERVGPHLLAEALVAAAEAAMLAALTESPDQVDAWDPPWRVLTALPRVLPYPFAEAAGEAITELRHTAPGRVLPDARSGVRVSGQVLWARDCYGSRFAVTAPIAAADQPARWYLWDIDACGHDAFTVHSGFYATPEAGLAAWREGVGQVASAGAVLAPVDDPWLLAALLPAEQGFMRPGGESAQQYAEYHRSKRLAEVVVQAVPRRGTPPGTGLTAAGAAGEFVSWLRARDPDLPDDLEDLATELADSWCINNIDEVFATCSPHRVALCVLHMREFYLDEFADQLVALLPEWIRWLATRNGTAPELAERCLPYAHGQAHPQLARVRHGPDYLARVVE